MFSYRFGCVCVYTIYLSFWCLVLCISNDVNVHKIYRVLLSTHSLPKWGILRLHCQYFLHVYITSIYCHFCLQTFTFKTVCANCCLCCAFFFILNVSKFSQEYDSSLSTSFSSKLHGNCPCILFPLHLSFIFSAMLSFICLIPLCNSVLRHLAVCNMAELMLCWCLRTVCISGSLLLSTYSTSFVVSTTWACF